MGSRFKAGLDEIKSGHEGGAILGLHDRAQVHEPWTMRSEDLLGLHVVTRADKTPISMKTIGLC